MIKRLVRVVTILLILSIQSLVGSVYGASDSARQLKELNFVFLHGAGGTICAMQLLSDSIVKQAQDFVSDYERANPGVKVQVNILQRCYPADADIGTWANNVADSITEHFRNKRDIILVGHSMGGKAALYAVAHNTQKLADKAALVVTINTPIKRLNQYYITGGGSVENYLQATRLFSHQGVGESVSSYDSSQDGSWVSRNKHWLAFISAEPAPLSTQFDFGEVDVWPRDMDDGVVPISAQYSEGADVVYYGEYGHSEFAERDEVARFMADQILRYLFGGVIESSVPARSGTFEHHAGWLPVRYNWDEQFRETIGAGGVLSHSNDSFLKWEEWEDVVGSLSEGNVRSSYQVKLINSLPLLTSISEARWLNPDSMEDYRLYLKTKAAPKNRVQLEWNILQHELLPPTFGRGHYEIRVLSGTALAGVSHSTWATDDPRDVRLKVQSQAEGPFRWFRAEWKVYSKESRQRKVIDEIPVQALGAFTQ